MKKLLGVLFVYLFISKNALANTYAVEFVDNSIFADFSIEVSTSSIFADEVWEIVGTCDGAFSYSTVEISENSIFADLDVEITKNSIFADKQICIKNPNSLPDWFIEMLNEL